MTSVRTVTARRALWLFTLPLLLAAADTRPDDYAFGWDVLIESPGDFQRLPLTREVLAAAQSRTLADLAVYDDDDQPVPWFLINPERAAPVAPTPVAVPLFETVERLTASGSGTGTTVTVQASGDAEVQAIVAVTAGGGVAPTERQWYATLSDAQLSALYEGAQFDWTAGSEPLVVTLVLETSDDLQYWRPLTTGAVARLASGQHTLKRDRIALNASLGRYLRISTIGAPADWQLTHLALLPHPTSTAPTREWAEQALQGQGGVHDIDLGGAISIDRFEVQLPPGAGLLRARLSSATEASGPWTLRDEVLFYRLEGGTGSLTSEPAAIAVTDARYWRIELLGDTRAGHRVRLGWIPTDLVFLAQGRAPYRLVAGSATRATAALANGEPKFGADARMLWSSGAETGLARLGPRQALAGERALRPSPVRDWRSYLLWSLLALGVMAVLGMSAQLLRETKRGPSAGD